MKLQEAVMVSVEVIEHVRKEEERRRQERDRPTLRIPVEEMPQEQVPEKAAPKDPPPARVVVLDMSRDDVEEFRIASW